MQRSPSRTGMPALVGLLLVVFAIAGLLVYEAWNTGRSRREIAERGLQDYAAYAAWSSARAGETALTASLSTLFRGITGNRVDSGKSVAPLSDLLAGAAYLEQCDCAMTLPTDYYFRYDARNGGIETKASPLPAPELKMETGWAAAKVGSYTPPAQLTLIPPDGRWLAKTLSVARIESVPNFALHVAMQNDSPLVIGLAPQRDSAGNVAGALGFVTSGRRFAHV